jgi:hypothetical protein
MSLQVIDGPTIARGESLSEGIDCSAGTIVRITVPQEFTEANLTFQVSSNGDLYNDLYDDRGDEITVTAQPDSTIVIDGVWVHTVGWLKLRSGSRDHPVVQTKDDCKFGIAIKTDDTGAATSSRGG